MSNEAYEAGEELAYAELAETFGEDFAEKVAGARWEKVKHLAHRATEGRFPLTNWKPKVLNPTKHKTNLEKLKEHLADNKGWYGAGAGAIGGAGGMAAYHKHKG